MIGTIFISGVIGQDTNLIDVIRQVKAQKSATEYLIKIDSVGGYVDVGFDIYNYLKNLDKPISTYALKAYSIASVIFFAGSKRIVLENAVDPLMIHLPWMEVAGSHHEITAHLNDLKAVEDKLIKFYSEVLDIDKETIQSLLTNETYLTAAKAFELGLATVIQPIQKAVAMINNKKEEESLMNKLLKKANQVYNKLSGVKSELTLQDATGVELTFPDLEPTDTASPDEKVTVDGKPAEGEYIMPDGSTVKVEKGVVTEIVPAPATPTQEDEPLDADAPVEEDAPADDKDAKIAELEDEITALKAKISELEGSKAEATEESESKMLEIVALAADKMNDLESKYQSLAKQIGSDFQVETKKENTPTVKANGEEKPKFSIKRK